MTDIVDPVSLRPGDVFEAIDRARFTVRSVNGQTVNTVEHGDVEMSPGPFGRNWTRECHLVSRAEPERGSVWRRDTPYGAEVFYEPDPRWPDRPWVRSDNGSRYPFSLADMTFVRSAVSS